MEYSSKPLGSLYISISIYVWREVSESERMGYEENRELRERTHDAKNTYEWIIKKLGDLKGKANGTSL